METLRTELIETQKVRSDLMKWKLLIVAGVGGAALGFSKDAPGSAHLAHAVLPLACFYVDLCCRHLSLRNKAIGLFVMFGKHDDLVLKNYEEFYSKISGKVWRRLSLESAALVGLTLFVSIVIVPVGILAGGHEWYPFSWPSGLFYCSGILGVLSALALQSWYMSQRKNMDKLITGKKPN